MEAARCENLTTAAVLIAGLAIDPALSAPAPPADPEGETTATERTESDEVVPIPPEPRDAAEAASPPNPADVPNAETVVDAAPTTPSPRTDVRERPKGPRVGGIVVADLGASLGRVAGPGGMLRLGGGIEVGDGVAFRGLVRATGVGPSVGEVDGSGGVFGAALFGLAGCGVVPFGERWAAVGCVGSDVGVALARGRDIDNVRSARAPWWGVDGELGLEVDVSRRVALTLRGDGGGVLAAPSFVVDGRGRVCCRRWSASARAGLRVRWGAP